jgi:threonine dehydrogenase-like Zn-dependent dehydrogenase
MALAMQLVRPRGKIVIRAVPPTAALSGRCSTAPSGPDKPLDLSPLTEHEVEVLGARSANPAEAIARLAAGEIDVLPLITRRVKFADAAGAITGAGQGEQLKVVVEM